MADKILFWRGLIGDNAQFEEYEPTINKLLSGDYQAADLDLKKLARHRVYTVRVNRSDRLLFTTVTIKGQPYLLLLEVIFNHDYQKSRFLKPYVLKQYLDTNIEALEETIISEESFLTCVEAPLTSKSMVREGEKLKFSSVEFYNNNFVEINDHQSQAIRIDLPAVISGTAGSGKTLVLFQILAKLAIKSAEPVVYVTQSDTLINNVKAMWEESPYSQGIPKDRVEFKTYIQFMHRLESTSKDKTLVGEDHFNDWIEKKYLVHCRNSIKAKGKNTKSDFDFINALASDINKIYQEFRILSAYTKDEYLSLGVGESLYLKEPREWTFHAFQIYCAELKRTHCINPAFYNFETKAAYSFIGVDEAQDFSHLQLKLLSGGAHGENIIYCIDSHQTLADNKSKRPYLLKMFKDVKHIELKCSYRCAPNIVAVANTVIKMKYDLTGGIADKNESSEIIPYPDETRAKGDVQWVTPSPDSQQELQQKAQLSPLVIITDELYTKEARDIFKTPLVFTVKEIKGLEYSTVMIYRPFDKEIFRDANKTLTPKTGSSEKVIHRPKESSGDDKFARHFNELFTSITRAQESLIIYQAEGHKLKLLTEQLKKALPNKEPQAPALPTPSPEVDWLAEAKKLYQNGNIVQAKNIFIEKLGKSISEFEQYFTGEENKTVEEKKSPDYAPAPRQEEKIARENTRKKRAVQSAPTSKDTDKKQETARSKTNTKTKTRDGITSVMMELNTAKYNSFVQKITESTATKSRKYTKDSMIKLLKAPNRDRLLFDLVITHCQFLDILADEDQKKILGEVISEEPKLANFLSIERLKQACPGSNNRSLVLVFFENSKHKELFEIFLGCNEWLANDLISYEITDDYKGTKIKVDTFNYLAIDPKKHTILYLLLSKCTNKKIMEILRDDLNKLVQFNSKYGPGPSAFFLLALHESGHGILKKFFDEYSDLTIEPEALFALPKAGGLKEITTGKPAFTYLIHTAPGQEILSRLLGVNPTLITHYHQKIFSALVQPKEVLTYLSSLMANFPAQEHEFLNKLTQDSDFFKAISQFMTELLSTLNNENNSKGLDFLLQNIERLSSDKGGIEILSRLFEVDTFRAELAKALSNPDFLGNEKLTMMIFYRLSSFRQGQILMKQILSSVPKWGDYLSILKTLLYTSSYGRRQGKRFSTLNYLTSNPELLAKFYSLSEVETKEIVTLLSTEDLFQPDENIHQIPLLNFLNDLKGIGLIKTLFKLQPELAKRVSITFLSGSLDQNQPSLLEQILRRQTPDQDALSVLKSMLYDRTNLTHVEFAIALCCVGKQWIRTPFYALSSIDSGRKLLGNIFKNNPQLGSFISSNALFSSDQAFYHDEAFYHLAKYNNGHEILNYLLDSGFKYSNWELAQALCKPLSNTNLDKYRHTTSPLYWLTCSETGLEVLLKMLKNNDELATMIAKDDALTLKRLGAGKSVGQNPLLLINKSPKTGQEIIVILKQANPELVNLLSTSIPANDSYTVSHNHSASRNNSANTFAFFPRQNTTQQINYEEKSPGLGN